LRRGLQESRAVGAILADCREVGGAGVVKALWVGGAAGLADEDNWVFVRRGEHGDMEERKKEEEVGEERVAHFGCVFGSIKSIGVKAEKRSSKCRGGNE